MREALKPNDEIRAVAEAFDIMQEARFPDRAKKASAFWGHLFRSWVVSDILAHAHDTPITRDAALVIIARDQSTTSISLEEAAKEVLRIKARQGIDEAA
jgi:hypothetical protein